MHSQLPPLNSIRVFDAAARLGSFKKAAEELHVTPTAISHQIKTLEEALGTLLFVRKTRVIQLTPEGKLLAETAYNILQQLTNTISEISNTKNIITVSTTSSFAAMWLVPNLSKFNQLYPDIDVAVKTGEQVEDLEKDRRIDLAIRYGTYDNSLKNSILLTTEEIGVYATPYYIKSINLLGSANLLETKWDNKNLTEISWHTLFKDNNNHELVYKTRQFTQEHHIIQAALAGQGIALVSSLLVQNAIEQGWLVKYHFTENRKKIDGFSYYLVIPEHNLRSKSIMAFKNWLVDELM
ncbi:substrate-binding transcriptional regulator, LysR family [Colwellia psychrerythraea 34H]|uniref:Substrate-binding transcriptional regulator, LysR family n=2 Tax=Colwellia psychrerythraea TaxID=28229 RepID=Q47ZU8_COLP3|nr:substrate-binding transcriptional regulator, LysR family [Colwellia psychrerythraea 34H]